MPKHSILISAGLALVMTVAATICLASQAWAGKKVDKASPSLFQHAVKGEHYKEATITMRRKAGSGTKSPGKPTFGNAR
jgi:Type VI secretion system effector, Hcp